MIVLAQVDRQGVERLRLLASQVSWAQAQLVRHIYLGELLNVTLMEDLGTPLAGLSACAGLILSHGLNRFLKDVAQQASSSSVCRQAQKVNKGTAPQERRVVEMIQSSTQHGLKIVGCRHDLRTSLFSS